MDRKTDESMPRPDNLPRKRYEPPRIQEEAEFEGLALKCATTNRCGAGGSGSS